MKRHELFRRLPDTFRETPPFPITRTGSAS